MMTDIINPAGSLNLYARTIAEQERANVADTTRSVSKTALNLNGKAVFLKPLSMK
jgi:hypothetical protein